MNSMEASYNIKYECIELVKNKSFSTEDYFEAVAYYKDGWAVIEHHITITRPSKYSSVKQIVSFQWNDNPEFEGVN
jgi:hypothetical protein